jgi:ADP-ribose pyrophosphatase YjhB (NUDIX family)
MVYRMWGILPLPIQRLIVRGAMPKVSIAACAVIEDAAGGILVVKHSYRRQPWGLPGGFVRRGEQPAAALRRELREELGVKAIIGPLLFAETDELSRHLTLYYQACIAGSLSLDGAELEGYRYVSVRELPALFPARPPTWLRSVEEAMAA